ncbi:MAG: hypothetical protein P4L67_00425 [Candidatus Pacebacteria bacterium]|nr:hypothetical protein [Candidatus Paceibacterota bacterium]
MAPMKTMKNVEKAFLGFEAPEPPVGLARTIMVRIERRERRVLIAKTAASACAFGASLLVIGVGLSYFRTSIAETGFLQLASLLFSDFSAIVANLPDFALSMLEAFPVFSAAAMLAGAGFAIWSCAAIIDEISAIEYRKFSFLR